MGEDIYRSFLRLKVPIWMAPRGHLAFCDGSSVISNYGTNMSFIGAKPTTSHNQANALMSFGHKLYQTDDLLTIKNWE